jgi:hypothetical protein
MLGDNPSQDARVLDAKADKLSVYHSHQQPGSVAPVASTHSEDEDQSNVTTVRGAGATARGSHQCQI